MVMLVILAILIGSSYDDYDKRMERVNGIPKSDGPPIECKNVTVYKRRKANENGKYNSRYPIFIYFIMFEVIEIGHLYEFEVSEATFFDLANGEKGKLRYQGDKFISFERIIEKADKVEEGK